YSAGLPSYALELSRNDVRHFNAWFNDTADNGLNAPATSDKRKVDLLVRGRRRSAVMELVAGRQTGPETSSKRTFTLELLDADGEPERKLLLRPVEGAPYLLDALAAKLARDCGLPPAAPEIVAVSTNGSFDGLYLAADLSGDKGSFWRGEAEQWRELITRLPFFRDQALAEFDRIAGRLKAPLCSDRKSPLTSREIVHEIRRQRRLLEDAALDRTPRSDEAVVARVGDFVREEIFLGDNPHASLIVGDLKLPPATVNGATLSFASLTPEVLSAAGHVTPQAGRSVTAGLRVSVARGGATRTRDLSFGVPARRLPVLRVESEGDPRRAAAIPCVAELIEADGRRDGLQPGKFRLRGNSVLVKNAGRKVYYRVEFDRPQEVPGIGRTRLLLLTSAWRDVALMRDRLVYDLFRSFSEPGKPRFAPHIRYVELVVNGDYKGIYNLTDRVDGDLLGFPKKAAGPDRPVLYKAKGGSASFTQIQRDAYVQKVPDWRGGEFWGPYDRLVRFVGNSTPAAFREGIEALVDVDEIMDFEILLLLRADMEGRNYNLYLARQGGPGARFFIVPWDADMSFYGTELASNALVHRLHADLPGYSRRVLERWRTLRRERLSEQELMRRIGGLETELAEAVGRNYRRWPLAEGWTWERDVDTLKKYLRTRLALLGRTFEEAAAADATAGRKTR
ncbi:MAG TPA: CotH kinase family protein, partial [bacterium]